MPYLTNYTFGKLCRELHVDFEITLEIFQQLVFKDKNIFSILNKNEIKYLFNYVELLRDEKEFMLKYYQNVPEKKDNKVYVFEKEGKLSYHLTQDCPMLAKDFKDFYIPDDIRGKGNDAINDYREWFKHNDFASKFFDGKIDLNTIVMRYNMIFPSKYGIIPLKENFKLLKEIVNSKKNYSNYSFDEEEFKKKLFDLKNGFHAIFSCPVLRTLSKFNGLVDKDEQSIREVFSKVFSPEFVDKYGLNNIKIKLSWSKKIKNDILQLMVNYFKWHYKANEKDFDKLTLDYFGLSCCKSCEIKEKAIALQF
jgi:hypothetical protein